jgi:hypothetical protein
MSALKVTLLMDKLELADYQVCEGADEGGGIVEGGHQLKLCDAGVHGEFARFVVDLG